MQVTPQQLFTKVQPSTMIGKIIQFPIIRIFLAVLFITPAILINNLTISNILRPLDLSYYDYIRNLLIVVIFVLVVWSYRWYTRLIERRSSPEFSFNGLLKEFGWGFLLGCVLISFMVGLLAVFSYYRIESFNPAIALFHTGFILAFAAFIEELVFRLIIYKIIEEYLGTWWSVIINALIFGFLHLLNENATLISSIALTLEGIIIIAVFVYSRRVWLAWGLHFAWNFFQEAVFGMANSGQSDHATWITSRVTGPEWLTGGAFGIEASFVIVLINVIIAIAIFRMASKRGQLVKPKWKRLSEPI